MEIENENNEEEAELQGRKKEQPRQEAREKTTEGWAIEARGKDQR